MIDHVVLKALILNGVTGAPDIPAGRDSYKDTAPNRDQIYYAVDTKKFYYCKVDGVWIEFNPLDIVNNIVLYRLPDEDGADGQVMKTDGNKNLYWDDVETHRGLVGLYFEGAATIGEYIGEGIKHDVDIVVKKASISVREASSGADIIISLTKNGVATGQTFILPEGQKKVTAVITPTPFSTSEEIGFVFTQIGTDIGGQGEGMNFIYHYEHSI